MNTRLFGATFIAALIHDPERIRLSGLNTAFPPNEFVQLLCQLSTSAACFRIQLGIVSAATTS
jgi:hypothetical protein